MVEKTSENGVIFVKNGGSTKIIDANMALLDLTVNEETLTYFYTNKELSGSAYTYMDTGSLYGGVWGQYTTRIVGSILFHSVPYFSRNKGDLEWEEYNKLGTQASLGCVRLAVRDVKWIFYNCPSGTKVHIYDGDIPAGIGKPSAIKIDGSNPNRGWDPTDDDPLNPWR